MKDGNSGEDVTCGCVFCEHPRAKLYPQRVGTYRRTGTKWHVVCNRCRARGPLDDDPSSAIRKWKAVKT